jgi:SOS response regulatory protein OraA/RecX
MNSYTVLLMKHATFFNMSAELIKKIVEKKLIPTQLINNLYFTTHYGSNKLKEISDLIDRGFGFSDIEKAIEH